MRRQPITPTCSCAYSRTMMLRAGVQIFQANERTGSPTVLKMADRPSKKCTLAMQVPSPLVSSKSARYQHQVSNLLREMRICPKTEFADRFYYRYGEALVEPVRQQPFLSRCNLEEDGETFRSTLDAIPALLFVHVLVIHALTSVGQNNHLQEPMMDPETQIWWGADASVEIKYFETLWKMKYVGVYDLCEILNYFDMTLVQLFATTPNVLQNSTSVYRLDTKFLQATDILFPPKEFPSELVHHGRTNLITLMSDPRFPLGVQPLNSALPAHHPWKEVVMKMKRILQDRQEEHPVKLSFCEQSIEIRAALKECGPIALHVLLKLFPTLFAIYSDGCNDVYVALNGASKIAKCQPPSTEKNGTWFTPM